MTRFTSALVFGLAQIVVACSGSDSSAPAGNSGGVSAGIGGNSNDSGGASNTGGVSTTGGANSSTSPNLGGNAGTDGGAAPTGGANSATGGAIPTGGSNSGNATGGKVGTGGSRTGGTVSTGGMNANTGGTPATGGRTSAGGNPATGGRTSTGGNSATGGVATGATTGGNLGAGGGGAAGSPGCGSPAGLVSGQATIDVNGVSREYILRVPDNYDPNKPYRLIFAWHQLAGTAQRIVQMGYYGLQTPSANQAILVAPQGLYQITPSSGNLDAGWWNNNGEDVNFYHAMLDQFNSKLCVDQNRIFSVGFSFGAMFSFTLACSPGSMLRAIAPQAGSASRCTGTQPVAVMGFVGTQDSLMNGHLQGVSTFAQRDGCSTETVAVSPSWCDGLATNYQPCSCVQYTNCNAGYPVVSCTYNNGHMFAPNSGQTIWNFFSQF